MRIDFSYLANLAKELGFSIFILSRIRRPPGVLLSSGDPALSQQFYRLSSTFQNSTESRSLSLSWPASHGFISR